MTQRFDGGLNSKWSISQFHHFCPFSNDQVSDQYLMTVLDPRRLYTGFPYAAPIWMYLSQTMRENDAKSCFTMHIARTHQQCHYSLVPWNDQRYATCRTRNINQDIIVCIPIRSPLVYFSFRNNQGRSIDGQHRIWPFMSKHQCCHA